MDSLDQAAGLEISAPGLLGRHDLIGLLYQGGDKTEGDGHHHGQLMDGELAVAMECRCYHGGEGRTRMRQLKYAFRDYIALTLGLGLCAAVFYLNTLGIF